MIPAFGMVILTQNLSTGDGQIPGWSCILSVVTSRALWQARGLEPNRGGDQSCEKPVGAPAVDSAHAAVSPAKLSHGAYL